MTIVYEDRSTDVGERPPTDGGQIGPLEARQLLRASGITLATVLVMVVGVALFLWPTETAENRILVADNAGGVFLVDPAEPEPIYAIEDAVASPDRSRLYQLAPSDTGSVVNEIDVQTGQVVASQPLAEPGLEIRIVSPNGDALALMPAREAGAGLYEPEARTETSITIVRASEDEPVIFDLDGNFEPEAFTRDGAILYLLEFWPAEAPERYFVRSLNLATGAISDTYSPEVDLNPEMRGHARAQVVHPDGDFLYTLYTLDEVGEPVIDPATGENPERWAFVHVISLDEDWSYCIFLPVPMGRDEATIGLAITPDGSTLYAIDAAADMIAAVDTESFEVTATAELRGWEYPLGERLPAAAGPDGSVYVVFDRMVVGYTPDLAPMSVWRTDTTIHSIDIAPDGETLRVAVPGLVKVVDLESGAEKASIRIPALDGEVEFVGPPLNPRSFTERLQKGEPVPCAC